MLTNFIYKSFKSGFFRKALWKFTYEVLPRINGSSDWQFMNYGYDPTEKELTDSMLSQDGFQWRSRAMYHCLARKQPLKGKNILEVGFGRGGGLSHISRNFEPSSCVGIDFSNSAVKLARRIHRDAPVDYRWGDATRMDLPSESFDVVLNVESSHAYNDLDAFFKEVHRVLMPKGRLLLVDLRTQENWTIFYESLGRAGLLIQEEENISQQVISAIEKDEPLKQAQIDGKIPKPFRSIFREFAGMVNSELHVSLKEGRRAYKRFVITRREN